MLIILILAVGSLLSGTFVPMKPPKPPEPIMCCNTADCHTTDPKIQLSGKTYGLLKSNITLTEGKDHLIFAGNTPDGKQIYISDTDSHEDTTEECRKDIEGSDFVASGPKGCSPVPDDNLIYICLEDCGTPGAPGSKAGSMGPNSRFDAYYLDGAEVPDVIKNCDKTQLEDSQSIVFPSGAASSGQQNLHLNYFKIVKKPVPWLSPYCKPAVYLYPEKVSDINVEVSAVGGLINTLPVYPGNGWNVTAHPDGQLSYQGVNMDYLYYESRVPDEIVKRPDQGWVVPAFAEASAGKEGGVRRLLGEELPMLGLNSKESSQFIDYWTKVLPNSKYYFIGIIPQSSIEQMSQLNITPKPDSTLRVTLYFEALDIPISVVAPRVEPVQRRGFTVVEWGGVFKKDKEHPFSCLM